MMEFLRLFSVGALGALFSRIIIVSVYLPWFRQGIIGDAAYHFCAIRELKKNKFFQGIPNFLLAEDSDTYPILFHRFCSVFKTADIRRWQYLPNLLIWILGVGIASAYVGHLADVYGCEKDKLTWFFIVVLLTLASNVCPDMNGLNYISLSERLLARISNGLYFLSMSVVVDTGDSLSICVSILAGTVVWISSLFGRQAIAFISPLVACVTLQFLPVWIMVVSFAGAVAIDGMYFLRGILQQTQYSIAYNRYTKVSPYYQDGLSRYVDLKKILTSKGGLGWRINELESHEPTRIIFRYPELLLILALTAIKRDLTIDGPASIAIAAFLVYAATTFKALRYLGEANRYLEYVLVFIAPFVIAREIVAANFSEVVVAAYIIWVGLVALWKYRAWSAIFRNLPSVDSLAEFLRKINVRSEDVIFPIPVPLGAAICARVQCNSVMYQGVAVSASLYSKYLRQPPFLNCDWVPIAAHFGVTKVVADKIPISATKRLMGWEYNFSGLKIIHESPRYIAYEINSLSHLVKSH
jgi:hypothetical protein